MILDKIIKELKADEVALNQKLDLYIKHKDKGNTYWFTRGRVMQLQETLDSLEKLNEVLVNEANRAIFFVDKLKEHPDIKIPYSSDIVAEWLIKKL